MRQLRAPIDTLCAHAPVRMVFVIGTQSVGTTVAVVTVNRGRHVDLRTPADNMSTTKKTTTCGQTRPDGAKADRATASPQLNHFIYLSVAFGRTNRAGSVCEYVLVCVCVYLESCTTRACVCVCVCVTRT